MAVIKITSPQAIGNVKLKVIGKPKLILVNGYWNRITNSIGISPGKGKKDIGISSLNIEVHLMDS